MNECLGTCVGPSPNPNLNPNPNPNQALYRNLSVNGQQLKIWWAKPRAADGDAPRHGQPGGASSAPAGPPPLPGAKVEAGQLRSLYPSMNPNAMGARPDH